MKTFSLCHATARLPDGWRAAHAAWRDNCDNWDDVEYILCIDQIDMEKLIVTPFSQHPSDISVAINKGRQCAVDAWNCSAKWSTGKFIIQVADDFFPCEHWDTELLKVIPDIEGEYVIETKTGTSADDEWRRLLPHSMLTRKYYERIGSRLFDPEYEGMYADDEFSEVARRDGVVIDARHLLFPHKHWIGTSVPFDEIYARQNSPERYAHGLEILGRRRKEGFPA